MKIAICISGICRGNVKKNIFHLKNIFPTADLFFSTWEGREKDVEEMGLKNVKFFPEPKINYHPLTDIPDDVMPPVWKTWQLREALKKDKALRDKMRHYTKQIIGHDYLLSEVPDEYDMIVRSRYDTYASTLVDFQSYLEESYNENKAIGFGTRVTRHKRLHNMVRLPHVWPDRHGPSKCSNDWGGYIMDPLIFHPRGLWNSDLVWKLHNESKLMGAERGWYQILSQPFGDTHESIYGGAQIEKYLNKTIH